jgi:hypothetical protein
MPADAWDTYLESAEAPPIGGVFDWTIRLLVDGSPHLRYHVGSWL